MASQICPICKKEFYPYNDGRPHTHCSKRCRKEHDKRTREVDSQFRKELGLSKRRSIAQRTKPWYLSEDK